MSSGRRTPALALLAAALAAPLALRTAAPAAPDPPGAAAEWPDRVELVPPPGVKLYGGADVESRTDARGTIFVAATAHTPGGFGAVLWTQRPKPGGGVEVTPIDLGDLYPGGRGSLSVEADGRLYLTVWGKDSRAYRLRIREWAARP